MSSASAEWCLRMLDRVRIAVLIAMTFSCVPLRAQPAQPSPGAAVGESETPRPYSLAPDKLKKAIEYAHARYWLHFIDSIYGIAVLLLILAAGLSARFRDWAEAASRRRWMQAIIFVPLLIFTNDALSLPLGIYGQHLELKFEQSIQSWPSWFWDWTKTELLTFAISILLAFLLYAVIRRSPRRWWFYFWLAALPLIFIGAFIEPFVIEPLFYKFEPLAAKHPALVEQLEKVVARGGLSDSSRPYV